MDVVVARPKVREHGGVGVQGHRSTRVFVTGLSVELKLEYVVEILALMGISDTNAPQWAITNDEISVIEAHVSSWGDIKLQEYEDTKRSVCISIIAAGDWPLDSFVTERPPLKGERQGVDANARGGLADFDLSPEESRMFHAIPNRHGWGFSRQQQNKRKGVGAPQTRVEKKPPPPPPDRGVYQ